jgi:nicotinate-nucleotide pyrophosphorylase
MGDEAAAYARAVTEAVERALAEDLGPEGDLTAALVPEGVRAQFALRARRTGVLAGRDCATETFLRLDPGIDLRWRADDGDEWRPATPCWRWPVCCGPSSPASAPR